MRDTLLIELLTEELPPKSLSRLNEAFANGVFSALKEQGFLDTDSRFTPFATPRRLAVLITGIASKQPDKKVERKGPSLAVALDSAGNPSPALLGFAKSCGVGLKTLMQGVDVKGNPCYVYTSRQKGQPLGVALVGILQNLLPKLPVAKTMRWGNGNAEFVRPVHGFLMLHGKKALKERLSFLEMQSGQAVTSGHRFLSNGSIKLPHADKYESLLASKGHVIANFTVRKEEIRKELEKNAGSAHILWDDALLDEVTALVEWPAVYSGVFEEKFLEIPQECLILSMKQHQKYFPLADKAGKLLPRFLVVSNLQTTHPKNIIHGNERVLRARLSDAKFFYEHDRKTKLADRVSQLTNVVFHHKLGSQLKRVERLQILAGGIAREIGADVAHAERAAYLCKADLLTDMVGEFPELQGVMGRYYALHDHEHKEVADAIEGHYHPRFAGDTLPQDKIAAAVALADKFYTLAGLFGIGQIPTGDKDPFGLRRAALGVIRILIERNFSLDLHKLVNAAFACYGGLVGDAHIDLESFIFDRLAGYLKDLGYSTLEAESVVSRRNALISQALRQAEAAKAFNALPEAKALAAANKRVANILKQAEAKGESFINAEADKLQEPAEQALFNMLKTTSRNAISLLNQGDFTGYLKTFAVLKSPVDAFFDSVMVMVDDPDLRKNRLALLADLRQEMNRVADISKLAV